ncbi:hypothetical protein GCM10010402_34430 [Actinomadura luteofluorescens]|uniref:right-handed parallel beta-helix repeat-containing protein n=1 Tax=Actinomadura luteofluorescens TaxID=46163 RepID=UPI0021644280|nr:right-handed parallel beta-helix repeat-containing protein [Actinomadura glauciflava]MCR3743113.1 Right handed beta helix region [Actinomadura glauciflava]
MIIRLCGAAIALTTTTGAAASLFLTTRSAPGPPACPPQTATATTPSQLTGALTHAKPGDVIQIAPGTYEGDWTATTSGTPDKPIWLCGGPRATLTNSSGYGLHLDGASWWHLYGFSVAQAKKGVVIDAGAHILIERLNVHDVGDEGVHLRRNTVHSSVVDSLVHSTGLDHDEWGEGVYIGSAANNWPAYTAGEPDRSDRNTVRGNTIYDTTAEPIDVKEGTTGGLIDGNTLDAGALTDSGGDSCADIKGNDWTISKNTCIRSQNDGWQTHLKEDHGTWGLRAAFTANTVALENPDGQGFAIDAPTTTHTSVGCDNYVTTGTYANTPCT